MSETDPRPTLGEVDWNSAVDEWESSLSFPLSEGNRAPAEEAHEGTPWQTAFLGPSDRPAIGSSKAPPHVAAPLRTRASWLEEEARALADPRSQARALVGVSELLALASEPERALRLAREARQLSSELPLATRQVRQLAVASPNDRVHELEVEIAHAPTLAARLHSLLLAADTLRLHGDAIEAAKRLREAYQLDPTDVRAPTALAALALAQGDAGATYWFEQRESRLCQGLVTALRLRGLEAGHASEAGEPGERADTTHLAINATLRSIRESLGQRDPIAATQALAELAETPSLTEGALWLLAAIGTLDADSRQASAHALRALALGGEPLAYRQLAARAIELGDAPLLLTALHEEAPFGDVERLLLTALANGDVAEPLARVRGNQTCDALADALGAVYVDRLNRRSDLVSGSQATRSLTRLGRLLGEGAPLGAIQRALEDIPAAPTVDGVVLETAIRASRWENATEYLRRLPDSEPQAVRTQGLLAAALMAERTGSRTDTARAWQRVLESGLPHESAVRVLLSLDVTVDRPRALLRIANESVGSAAGILLLEAAFWNGFPEEEQAQIFLRIEQTVGNLGLGAELAQQHARRCGDSAGERAWAAARRSMAADPLEGAVHAVREALGLARHDREKAGTALRDALALRPEDVALRDMVDRFVGEPTAEETVWRDARTAAANAQLEAKKSAVAQRSNPLSPQQSLEAYRQLARLDPNALPWHYRIVKDWPHAKESLRYVEYASLSAGAAGAARAAGGGAAIRLDDAMDRALQSFGPAEAAEIAAHAQMAARVRMAAEQGWESTYEFARVAAANPSPSTWALRALNSHARVHRDEEAIATTGLALAERTESLTSRATLLVQASRSHARLGRIQEARELLAQAANEDPGDIVTWRLLGQLCETTGDLQAAAEAYESLGRTCLAPDHVLAAWSEAARLWQLLGESDLETLALEQCAKADVTQNDLFARLCERYRRGGRDADLADLLARRLEHVRDANERSVLEVERARALVNLEDYATAKSVVERTLAEQPNHATALGVLADVEMKAQSYHGAEQAYLRLARLVASPDEQLEVYRALASLYFTHLLNLDRAEVAHREVLRRAPGEIETLERLVEIYRRKGDAPRGVEVQRQLVDLAMSTDEKILRTKELASIHETVGRDVRRAEQTLDALRREHPTSVAALRALAEFYWRQRQIPAMHILLDRAASDARRAFAAGRFAPSTFETLQTAYELRGKGDPTRVVAATLAAVEDRELELQGGEWRAIDPRLDNLLAPEIVNPSLRVLLLGVGDYLDNVVPYDLRAVEASPLESGALWGATVRSIAASAGLGEPQMFVSAALGRTVVPLSSSPPALLVGKALVDETDEKALSFMATRAVKAIVARASAFIRCSPDEVALLFSALVRALNPSFDARSGDQAKAIALAHQIARAMPRTIDPNLGVLALEAAGTLGGNELALSQGCRHWMNRVGLLAVGHPASALRAVSWDAGEDRPPTGAERTAWLSHHDAARDLLMFSMSDPYMESRALLGLDR